MQLLLVTLNDFLCNVIHGISYPLKRSLPLHLPISIMYKKVLNFQDIGVTEKVKIMKLNGSVGVLTVISLSDKHCVFREAPHLI